MTAQTDQRGISIKLVLGEVHAELLRANDKFPPFHSAHEGYAVIKEELDELWDAVRIKGHTDYDRYLEAKQVAAMAVRFMLDLGSDNT